MQNDKGGKTKPCSCKQDWQRNDAHCCLGIEYECDTLEKGERVKAIWVQAENRFRSNAVTTVVGVREISINHERLLSHATLIWWHKYFHSMLMNYG